MELKEYEFSETFPVFRHEGDCFGNILPGGVLRFAQQVATDQCTQYGITDDTYAKTKTAYVLAKQALHFYRTPRVDEQLTFLTQPEALKRAVNKRVTSVLDQAGHEVALVDSRWVLIDTDKRTILRKHPPEVCGPWAECVDRELPMRMEKPETAEPAGEYTARYSRCDMNGHLNNTRYADLLCDLLPSKLLRQHPVQDMLFFYHREVPLGETITLRRAQTGADSWYFTGWRQDRCCFEATVSLCGAPKQV